MSITYESRVSARGAANNGLAQKLSIALRATLFESRLTVTPRRAAAIAAEAASSFEDYLAGQTDAEAAWRLGGYLVKEGLGHNTLLALLAALDGHGAEGATPGRTPLGFCLPVLGGYMAAREDYLLKEQERIRLALERARLRMEQ